MACTQLARVPQSRGRRSFAMKNVVILGAGTAGTMISNKLVQRLGLE